ncbi:MAG: hypothetical protein HYY84_02860 [Deltaproteobacteria bacterium]|nr:hypothetical protein [Deltaproteobacteria bacterium]
MGSSTNLRPLILTFFATAVLGGCASSRSVSWTTFTAFHAEGRRLKPASWNYRTLAPAAISSNLHHVSISIDEVFLRNLPHTEKGLVVLGVAIDGLRATAEPAVAIIGIKPPFGPDRFLRLEHPLQVDRFLFKGEPVRIGVITRPISPNDAEYGRAAIDVKHRGKARLTLHNAQSIKDNAALFEKLIDAPGLRRAHWIHSIPAEPADRIYRTTPKLLFVAGTTVFIAVPPPESPPEFVHARIETFPDKVELKGSRLVWRSSGADFTDLPYMVVTVTKHKRSPYVDTALRKAVRALEAEIETNQIDAAKATAARTPKLISDDRSLSIVEKNLERALLEWRTHSIDRKSAAKAGSREVELRHLSAEIESLCFVARQFHKILERSELESFMTITNAGFERMKAIYRDIKEDPAPADVLQRRCRMIFRSVGPPLPLPPPLPTPR